MEKWKEYFMRLLGRVKQKVVRGARRERREEDAERKIGKEKIMRVIRKLKDGKAAGIDGILSEAWKYGEEKKEQWAWKFCNKVWRGERWPENWKKGIIAPIVKKREGKRVKKHRR